MSDGRTEDEIFAATDRVIAASEEMTKAVRHSARNLAMAAEFALLLLAEGAGEEGREGHDSAG